jgi:hypothetical protein
LSAQRIIEWPLSERLGERLAALDPGAAPLDAAFDVLTMHAVLHPSSPETIRRVLREALVKLAARR